MAGPNGTPNVGFIRKELREMMPQYTLIKDCIEGEVQVKKRGKTYLPQPDPTNTSQQNKLRYDAYKLRAAFYNVTRRTLSGLVGQVFMRDPIMEIPAVLNPLIEDATGTGVNLIQQAKKSLSMTLAYARSGIFIDYPESEGATVEDIASGAIRPTISSYLPQHIVNWRVVERGAIEMLSLVVLAETFLIADDGFETKHGLQFRVLKLVGEVYVQEIWREAIPTEWKEDIRRNVLYELYKTVTPTDYHGNTINYIPFKFIGSEDNNTEIDDPAMYDMAAMNIAHYRNSADYEEACYIMGQPTLVITGLTDEWALKVLPASGVTFGSRGGLPLPQGGDAKLLQAGENSMIKEAMDTKELQMIALGAKLVEQKQVQRTAFETKVEATSEGSILSSTAKNVSAAYKWALEVASIFVADSEVTCKFELNTDFDIARMTPEEVKSVIATWQAGGITFEEMRTSLRKAGTATEDDVKAKAKIEADTAAAMAMEQVYNEPPATGE